MRALLKRKLLAAPVLLFGTLGFGGWGLWPVNWTSQARGEFPAAVDRYYAAVAPAVEAAPLSSFVHTGHRAGSFEEFAKDLHGGIPAQPKPVSELMDRAFDELGLTSVEVDVRSSPLNERDRKVLRKSPVG